MKLPPYSTFPDISGDNILLRQIHTSDIKDIIEISFYDSKQATTIEEAIEMQNKIDQNYLNGNSIHWGIADITTNNIIGTCGYYRGFENGTGELGCVLLPQFRGQGFMTNAMKLAISFGLNNIGINRIIAITTEQNHKAIKLIEGLGFVKTTDLQDALAEYEYKSET